VLKFHFQIVLSKNEILTKLVAEKNIKEKKRKEKERRRLKRKK